jgi:hypothetical protein
MSTQLNAILDQAKATATQQKPAPGKNKDSRQPQTPAESYVPNPDMVMDDVVAAPPFPIDILPERIQRVIRDCEQYMSFPADITASGILAAVALAIGRTHRLYYQGEWRETACMYMAIVAPPGSAKSHPLKFALEPIIQANKRAIKEYAKAQQQLAQDGLASDNLVDRQCLFSDFTIEALTRSIQKNARGIGVYIDELRAWFANFNRYNAGSEQEFWLQNWSGMSMAITRLQKKAWLDWPSISVVGTIQPSMLEEIGKGGRAQNGFAERMLFVFPDNVPVIKLRKRMERSDTGAIMQKNYHPIIQTILDMKLAIQGNADEEAEPWEVVLEASADDLVTDYINALKLRMEGIDNEYLRNVYSKMQTYTLRFCLIINRLEYACQYQSNREFPPNDDYTVTLDQAHRACQLTEYFIKHALKSNSAINSTTPLSKMPRDIVKFYRALPIGQEFTTRDAEDAAVKFNISRATMFRLLSEMDTSKRLFAKVRHGVWERLYV